jgi:hypothetical protein
MGSTEKRLKDRELVLLIADAAGGKLEGRTIAQKLAYFGGVILDQTTGHTPYYFGPFSYDVERALNLASLSGEFQETIERIPDWHGGPDANKHTYALTKDGRKEVEAIRESHPEESATIDRAVQAIADAVPGFHQKTLSAAAKIHLIVSEQDDPVPLSDIRQLARELGWHLSTNEIKKTIQVLKRLELVEVSPGAKP